MEDLPQEAITGLLARWGGGDQDALRHLIPLVYSELYKLSSIYLSRESSETMDSTGLVNEVYLRLAGISRSEFRNRAHFYGAAASIIRRILVDRARARRAEKRQGQLTDLGETALISDESNVNHLDLHNALVKLEALDERKSKIVELRYFAGLSIEHVAEILDLSTVTVKREWRFARTWLYEQIRA